MLHSEKWNFFVEHLKSIFFGHQKEPTIRGQQKQENRKVVSLKIKNRRLKSESLVFF